jgi:hypothetical protein
MEEDEDVTIDAKERETKSNTKKMSSGRSTHKTKSSTLKDKDAITTIDDRKENE